MPKAKVRSSRQAATLTPMPNSGWRISARSGRSAARVGRLQLKHGSIATPAFMTIATRGSVKAVEVGVLKELGVEVLLANTYHLWIRPGLSLIKKAGGLHRFMGWPGPILTDSGGYQVFSLAGRRQVTDRGVLFKDEVDGSARFLTPEQSMNIQGVLGSDIAMVLDECPPYRSPRTEVAQAVERTTGWAVRCLKKKNRGQRLFAIVQGGNWRDLRVNHARTLRAKPFDGYAVGGVAMGSRIPMTFREIVRVLDWVMPELPAVKPRYLMGVGPPDQIVAAVRRGVDLFDCVLPTRNARHGLAYVRRGQNLLGRFWSTLKLSNASCRSDLKPIDPSCDCPTCRTTTRAYLRHLFVTRDPLAMRLATIHNIRFYQQLMADIRAAIHAGRL